jgi:hypothetical protein
MKKILTVWAVFLIAGVLLPAGAMAKPNFMVNVSTTQSDAFYKVAVTSDGGYAGFGKAYNDAVVSKFNPYGYLEWSKSFPGVVHSNCNSGAAGETGIFLVGRTASNNLWVVKLAPWGQILWQKTYTYTGYSSANMMGTSTVATADGGCVVGLRVNVDGTSGAYSYDQGLAKIAADGTLEWAKFYGTAAYDLNGEIIESRDTTGAVDGYVMAIGEDGFAGADDNEVVLIKVDTNGVIQWVKSYAGLTVEGAPDGNEFVKGICQTADTGYAVVGNSPSANDPAWATSRRTPYILKVAHDGTKVWAKRFGVISGTDPGANAFTYGAVTQAEGSTDLILAGHTFDDDFWLLRLSEDGGLVAEKAFPAQSSDLDQLGSVDSTDDGGAVASRWSKSFGAGDYDAFMMKFDAGLSFPGTDCDGGYDPGSAIADMGFTAKDVTSNTHELNYTSQWTTADDTTAEADPGFYTWYCATEDDADEDGVADHLDNCPLTSNSGQEDGDGDGIGNACDCDLNNDGNVGMADYMQFRSVWGTTDHTADFNADNNVGMADFTMLRGMWGSDYPWY